MVLRWLFRHLLLEDEIWVVLACAAGRAVVPAVEG